MIGDNMPSTKYYDFSEALNWLKQGEKVARKGWNGKGMYIFLDEGKTIPNDKMYDKRYIVEGTTETKLCSHINMKTADDSIVIGWLASQTDMLAEDWVIV